MAGSTIWAPRGDKGPTGDQGPPGPQGPVGPQGPEGGGGPDTVLRANLLSANGANYVAFSRSELGAVINKTLQTKLREEIPTALDFGAPTDGVTSANTQLTAANTAAVSALRFPVGNYLISADLTLSMPIIMEPGSRFTVPNGVTLTIANTFNATLGQKFICTGTGKVAFTTSKVLVGYPEWWGAVTNSFAVDCLPALTACFIALPITQLQAADYVTSAAFNLNVSSRTLIGAGCFYYSTTGQGTRIVVNNGSSHVITVGPSVQPASINDFPQGIYIRDLLVTRAVAPVIASGCVGVYSRWTLYQTMERVKSSESMTGFQNIGTVQSDMVRCVSFRSIAGTGAGTDTYRGFHIDGTTVLTGVAGGNASCHWTRCVSGCVLTGITSYGMFVNGSWADTFIDNFEASVCTVGIALAGDTMGTLNFRTVDLHIIKPIIDQFSFAGIFFDGSGPFGTVSIIGGYAAPVGTGTPTACVYANNSSAVVQLSGGFQAICGPNTTMTAGIFANNSTNFHSRGNIVAESSTAGVLFNNSNYCSTEDKVMNTSRVATVGFALQGTSSRNTVVASLNGAAAKVGIGIQLLGASTQFNNIDPSGINPAVLTGAKLQINGATVSTTGLTGTNYVTGVVA